MHRSLAMQMLQKIGCKIITAPIKIQSPYLPQKVKLLPSRLRFFLRLRIFIHNGHERPNRHFLQANDLCATNILTAKVESKDQRDIEVARNERF